MDVVQPAPADDQAERLVQTQRLLDEMERLNLRARLLLAEHRHVVATISDLQQQLEATIPLAPLIPPRGQ